MDLNATIYTKPLNGANSVAIFIYKQASIFD